MKLALLKRKQSGFTIIELLISTTVLSFILLAVSFTVIEISRMYYKGIVITRTQDAARTLVEGVSRPIQFENSTISDVDDDGSGKRFFCVGRTRYTFALNKQQNGPVPIDTIKHAVWRDQVDNAAVCADNPVDLNNPTNGKDMLSDGMRITEFDVLPDGDTGLWSVNITVMYGDRDLMEPLPPSVDSPTQCAGAIAGSQWCAKASYKTKVYKRI